MNKSGNHFLQWISHILCVYSNRRNYIRASAEMSFCLNIFNVIDSECINFPSCFRCHFNALFDAIDNECMNYYTTMMFVLFYRSNLSLQAFIFNSNLFERASQNQNRHGAPPCTCEYKYITVTLYTLVNNIMHNMFI